MVDCKQENEQTLNPFVFCDISHPLDKHVVY